MDRLGVRARSARLLARMLSASLGWLVLCAVLAAGASAAPVPPQEFQDATAFIQRLDPQADCAFHPSPTVPGLEEVSEETCRGPAQWAGDTAFPWRSFFNDKAECLTPTGWWCNVAPLPPWDVASVAGACTATDYLDGYWRCSVYVEETDGPAFSAPNHSCVYAPEGAPSTATGWYWYTSDGQGAPGLTLAACVAKLSKAPPPPDRELREQVALTIEITGPGRAANCEYTCTLIYEQEDPVQTVSILPVPDEPMAPQRWVGCDSVVKRRCFVKLNGPRTVHIYFDPVVSYAPAMVFHPDEKRWPTDPDSFIENSSLRWANFKTVDPKGRRWRPCSDKASVRLKARHKVNAKALGNGGYLHDYCVWGGEQRLTSRYKSNTLTSPSRGPVWGKPLGKKLGETPFGRSGFYLDLNDDLYTGTKPKNGGGPRIFTEYEPGKYIIYWFFYNHNNVTVKVPKGAGGCGLGMVSCPTLTRDKHEGDWEHIAVQLDANERARTSAYYKHYCPAQEIPWSDTRKYQPGSPHPVVYVARGAHASYPRKAGIDLFACRPAMKDGWKPKPLGMFDYVKETSKSHRWNTWMRGRPGFADARKADWYGFGGGWGHTADSMGLGGPFWGPLGPGPLKYREAQGGSVIPAWWDPMRTVGAVP